MQQSIKTQNANRQFLLTSILTIFGLIPNLLLAQTAGTTLSGKVTGRNGAGVPNATVLVKDIATGRQTAAQTDSTGVYRVPGLIPGDYEVSVSAPGLTNKTAKVTITTAANETANFALAQAPGNLAGPPSLGDLGFPSGQTQGNAQRQALLDKRSRMLQIHQRLGLITTIPLLATVIAAGNAGRKGGETGRDIHAALGGVTVGMYMATAYYAIRAPKVPGTKTRGPIRLHKALAWVHGPGMILTPILGILAYEQLNKGEKVHGLAAAHSAVGWVTAGAYGAAILSVSVKF